MNVGTARRRGGSGCDGGREAGAGREGVPSQLVDSLEMDSLELGVGLELVGRGGLPGEGAQGSDFPASRNRPRAAGKVGFSLT